MGVWQDDALTISAHEFMLTAGIWPDTSQFAEIANEIATLNRRKGRQLYRRFHANINVNPINEGNLIFPGEAEK